MTDLAKELRQPWTTLLSLLLAAGLLAPVGIAAATKSTTRATAGHTAPLLSAQEYRRQQDWRTAIGLAKQPRKGCFIAAFPSREWREVPCVPTPDYPMPPRAGIVPQVVGNGNDIAVQAPTGHISSAVGSFDTLTNVASESGQIGATGANIANAYTLQINTDFFTTSACTGSTGANCRGWEQFVFENNNVSHRAFIQYWLIKYNNTCPAGWTQFPNGSDIYCVILSNSTGAVSTAAVPVTNLGQVTLTGTANSGSDSIVMTIGSTAYARNGDNAVRASEGWTIAEFNILGDGGSAVGVGSQAGFNAGAALVTRTRIAYGGTAAPNCVAQGFTAETNNLSFGPTAPVGSTPGPALIFAESIAGGSPSNCAASTAVGDTHLTTLGGLLYDFQASGDFTLLETASDFTVQNRQVSGAPNWPDASVSSGVAARLGKTEVAICLKPDTVFVDSKAATLEKPLVLDDGTQVTRTGNVVLVRGANGDWLRVANNTDYLDVKVGLGQWPMKTRGLLANVRGNRNLIAARDGTILTNPFPFEQLYHRYADSWRVDPASSMLKVCGDRVRPGIPGKPFGPRNLPPEVGKRVAAICTRAGVRPGPLMDACMIDVAVIGRAGAARVYAQTPVPPSVAEIGYRPRAEGRQPKPR